MPNRTSKPLPAARRPRRGFALGVVLIFLFALTAALAAGFATNLGERRIDDGGLQSVQSLSLAENGLERAIVDRAGLGLTAVPPAAAESVRVSTPEGKVDVIVTLVRPAITGQPALYLLRAHGIRSGARAGTGGASAAEQTVSQLAEWKVGSMTVQSGWTSLTGLVKNGASGSISGTDQCGVKPAIPAVAVPASPGYAGSTAPLSGASPLVDTIGATAAAAAAAVPINWPGIVNGSALTPTYTVPPDAYPASSLFSSDTNFFPVIKIVNPPPGGSPFTLPYPGRGMLIVEGSLVVSGSNQWSGVVLVGGTLTSNGNNTVAGATVTGLNVMLGISTAADTIPTSIGNGTKQFLYNSCSVARATAGLGRFQAFPNTWSTSWPTY